MPAVQPAGRRGARTGRSSGKPRRTAAALVRALDDPGRGALLDALLEVRTRTADAATTGWAAETLAALAEGLLERLAAEGIRPLHVPGEVLVLTARQLAGRFEYHGSPFRPGERRKRVVVAAPGWAVGRRIVVRPVVREAPADEAR
jgi:hypothetical protein